MKTINTFNTYSQTRASIKILEALQKIRTESIFGEFVVYPNSIGYNKNTGVCFLFIQDLNITICADEFGNDAYIENNNNE